MSISNELREQVRQRAHFACEFCGVSETDAGGELTLDHYQPKAKGGSDDLENLLYCCTRCNLYKADFWRDDAQEPKLWNPRREPIFEHFFEQNDGTLHPLTAVGAFSLQRLRLNRQALVSFRLRKRHQAEQIQLLSSYRELIQLLERMNTFLSAEMQTQRQLLEEQRELLKQLLSGRD